VNVHSSRPPGRQTSLRCTERRTRLGRRSAEQHSSDQHLNHRCSGRWRRRQSWRAPPPPEPRLPDDNATDRNRFICAVQSKPGLLNRCLKLSVRHRSPGQLRQVVGEMGKADQRRHHCFQQDQARPRNHPLTIQGGLERGLDCCVCL
jgi:hypothetical protein